MCECNSCKAFKEWVESRPPYASGQAMATIKAEEPSMSRSNEMFIDAEMRAHEASLLDEGVLPPDLAAVLDGAVEKMISVATATVKAEEPPIVPIQTPETRRDDIFRYMFDGDKPPEKPVRKPEEGMSETTTDLPFAGESRKSRTLLGVENFFEVRAETVRHRVDAVGDPPIFPLSWAKKRWGDPGISLLENAPLGSRVRVDLTVIPPEDSHA